MFIWQYFQCFDLIVLIVIWLKWRKVSNLDLYINENTCYTENYLLFMNQTELSHEFVYNVNIGKYDNV